jgi:hypothetical protein
MGFKQTCRVPYFTLCWVLWVFWYLTTLKTPIHPQTSYIYAEPTAAPKKKNNNNNNRRRRNKAKQHREDLVWMVNTIETEYDHLLPSPYLTKKDDPGVQTLDCKIEKVPFTRCSVTSAQAST